MSLVEVVILVVLETEKQSLWDREDKKEDDVPNLKNTQ